MIDLGALIARNYEASIVSAQCDYQRGQPKKVICLETKEVFQSMKICANVYKVSATHITDVCKSEKNYSSVIKKHFKFFKEQSNEVN